MGKGSDSGAQKRRERALKLAIWRPSESSDPNARFSKSVAPGSRVVRPSSMSLWLNMDPGKLLRPLPTRGAAVEL